MPLLFPLRGQVHREVMVDAERPRSDGAAHLAVLAERVAGGIGDNQRGRLDRGAARGQRQRRGRQAGAVQRVATSARLASAGSAGPACRMSGFQCRGRRCWAPARRRRGVVATAARGHQCSGRAGAASSARRRRTFDPDVMLWSPPSACGTCAGMLERTVSPDWCYVKYMSDGTSILREYG